MMFHWQNLSKKKHQRLSIPWEGCFWLHLFGLCFRFEWCFWRSFCHLEFTHGVGWRFVTLSGALPGLAVWATLGLERASDDPAKVTRISFQDWRLGVRINRDPMCWSSRDPKWLDFSVSFTDVLLGQRRYSETKSEEFIGWEIPMLEKEYKSKIRMFTSVWKRPRWFEKRIRRATVEVKEGIPVPGRGENAWDCGEDAIYSWTFPCETVEEAISHVLRNLVKTRLRRGGKNWIPKPKPQ